MSKPRYGWWSYAKYMVREYPTLKREHLDHQLAPAKKAEYYAVLMAVEQTKGLQTGRDRLALVDMVFWSQSHTLDGAAYVLGYSAITAKRFHGDFLRLVGFYRGLVDGI